MNDNYQQLKSELSEMINLSAKAPEPIQALAFNALLGAFQSNKPVALPSRTGLSSDSNQGGGAGAGEGDAVFVDQSEIPGIAIRDTDGSIKITARDLGAKTKAERARRLVYVAIRASERLTGNPVVSRKQLIVPLMRDWRLYDGNSRRMLAQDKGIQKSGDQLSLDTPGTVQADEYIDSILKNE